MTKITAKNLISRIKLPFIAKGWKSEKNPVIVKDGEQVAEIKKEKKVK